MTDSVANLEAPAQRVAGTFMGEDGVREITLHGQPIPLRYSIHCRGGDWSACVMAPLNPRQVGRQPPRPGVRSPGQKETSAAFSGKGMEKNDPRLLGLAGSHASSGHRKDRGKFVHLGSIKQHPALMMMKQSASVVAHVELGTEAELPLVGNAADSTARCRALAKPGEKQPRHHHQGRPSPPATRPG